MANEKTSKAEEPSHSQEELADEELDKVAGGASVSIEGATPPPIVADVISPRDPASGMPTGKRMHKPFTIT